MNRRKFLRQSAFTIPVFTLWPSLITSCKKKSLEEDLSYDGRVVVIGAGAAGLYAGYLLNNSGINVTILEAGDRIGGRVKTLKNFADFNIDLGAEKIYGTHSLWHDMVMAGGGQPLDSEPGNLYYFNGTLKTEAQATENSLFVQMQSVVDSIAAYAGDDITAEAWGGSSNISDNVEHIFNAWIGNRHGTSNSRIGMYGLRQQKERWTAGDENYLLKNTDLLSILETRMSSVFEKVNLQTQVTTIDYSGSKVILTDANGNTHEADKVIVTVPLSILQSNDIAFIPALPPTRTEAIQNIGMDTGMKIILKFDEPVWPAATGSIFSNGLIPEFRPTAAGGRSGNDNLMTAFVCGQKAEALASLGDAMIPTILGELDNLFGDATAHYTEHVIQDWGAEPYVKGVGSYARPGTGSAREVLATPLNEKIYFAGEATHTEGHHATVHGAMETGLRAVMEILGA